MATTENRLVQPRHVVLLLGLGFVLIFITALVYRLSHPNLTLVPMSRNQAMQSQAEHDHGDEVDMNQIAALMAKMRENPDDPEILKSLGQRFMHMKAFEQAKGFLEKAVMIQPSDVEAMTMLGVTLFNMQRYEEAAEQFELVLSLAPDNTMAKFNLGVINKYGLNNPDKAREYFEDVVKSDNIDEHIREEAKRELQ